MPPIRGNKGRTEKMRPIRGNKGSSSSSNKVNTFPSSPRYGRDVFDKYAAGKEVLIERSLNLDHLRGYIPEYINTLEEWGWTNFLQTKKYVMPSIVKHFYFFGEDKVYDIKGAVVGHREMLELPTKIFNERFTVSVDMVNEIVGVRRTEGPSAMPKMTEGVKLEYIKTVFKKEHLSAIPADYMKVSYLDIPERILHYVIGQCFFARKRASEITDLDLFCMTRIMKNEPFNFGAFVIAKMHDACVRVRGDRPYHCQFGKIITLLCERIFGVERLRNIRKVEDSNKDSLEDTVKLMKFRYRGGVLVSPGYEGLENSIANSLRGQGEASGSRHVGDEVEDPQGDDLTISMASMMQILKRIESNQVEMRSTLYNVDTRLQRIEQRFNDEDEEYEEEDEVEGEEDFDENDGGDGMEP